MNRETLVTFALYNRKVDAVVAQIVREHESLCTESDICNEENKVLVFAQFVAVIDEVERLFGA